MRVRHYAERGDQYGLPVHRAIFERFAGPKREYAAADRPLAAR